MKDYKYFKSTKNNHTIYFKVVDEFHAELTYFLIDHCEVLKEITDFQYKMQLLHYADRPDPNGGGIEISSKEDLDLFFSLYSGDDLHLT